MQAYILKENFQRCLQQSWFPDLIPSLHSLQQLLDNAQETKGMLLYQDFQEVIHCYTWVEICEETHAAYFENVLCQVTPSHSVFKQPLYSAICCIRVPDKCVPALWLGDARKKRDCIFPRCLSKSQTNNFGNVKELSVGAAVTTESENGFIWKGPERSLSSSPAPSTIPGCSAFPHSRLCKGGICTA